MVLDVLRDALQEAIVCSDCDCKPGDPTCQDWRDTAHRWEAQTDAAVRAVRQPPRRTKLALLAKGA